MRIALCSDEPYAVNEVMRVELERLGHQLVFFGSVGSGQEQPWPEVAEHAGLQVSRGECELAICFCWSGTGICMALNKLPGIRAALCADAQTARAAREWNDANVLCLSNRSLSPDVAREILAAWFDASPLPRAESAIQRMNELDERYRSASAARSPAAIASGIPTP
ncbi:MAG: ribose/galactose isomerase [Pseudomonadota bacterium]